MSEELDQILAAINGIAQGQRDLAERIEKLEQAQPEPEEVDERAWWAAHGRIIGEDGLTDAEREAHERANAMSTNVEARVIELPAPSPEKRARRLAFATNTLKLNDTMPPGAGSGIEDWNEWYADAGPYALVLSDRGIVMTYPAPVRQMMVVDIEQDDPELAAIIASDLLKRESAEPDFEHGAGALAVGTIDGRSLKRNG